MTDKDKNQDQNPNLLSHIKTWSVGRMVIVLLVIRVVWVRPSVAILAHTAPLILAAIFLEIFQLSHDKLKDAGSWGKTAYYGISMIAALICLLLLACIIAAEFHSPQCK